MERFQWPLLVTTVIRGGRLWLDYMALSLRLGQTHLLMAGAVITIIPILIVYFPHTETIHSGVLTTGLNNDWL